MKVALIHDWLVGMRGGEKCLEVFCELYPKADLYTLVYAPESISATIRRMNVRTSWPESAALGAQILSLFVALFPQAVEQFDLGAYDLILSVATVSPRAYFPIARSISLIFTRRCAMYGICTTLILPAPTVRS